MRRIVLKLIPWVITAIALYYAFAGVEWAALGRYMGSGDPVWLLLAVLLTIISYLLRGYRWKYFFAENKEVKYWNALRVLLLGFLMNNTLPARAGELVRAVAGARIFKKRKTLILATIASERLVDGLVLSAFFLAFAVSLAGEERARDFLKVALVFVGVGIAVLVTLGARKRIFSLTSKIATRLNHKASDFTLKRLEIFINGLAPLARTSRLPAIALWSLLIWLIELAVYFSVAQAFNAELSLTHCVLFMVAVNFASLVPSAPGAFGVIEVVGTEVLRPFVGSQEFALSLVLTQHLIQYLVVGAMGIVALFSLRGRIGSVRELKGDDGVKQV